MSPRAYIPTVLTLAALTSGTVAHGHPLGLSSINRYVGVHPEATDVQVDYLLDLAELPAWTEIEALDADHDGAVTPAERDAYITTLLPRLSLTVRLDGRAAVLRPGFHSIEAPPGQNGLSTLRIAITFDTPLPGTSPVSWRTLTVTVNDPTWSDHGGWREIDPIATPTVSLVSSSLPGDSPRAGASLAYPTAASLPREDTATFVFRHTPAPPDASPTRRSSGHDLRAPVSAGRSDGARLVDLLRTPPRRIGKGFVLYALALAFALGAGHALGPGHGKTLTGSWLVGTRARVRDALALGLVVTVTHTATVFALGLAALAVEHSVGSTRLLRALELTSALLVTGIGLRQIGPRMAMLRAGTTADPRDDGHLHGSAGDAGQPTSWHTLLAVGVSGGMVPCPGALVVLLAAVGMHRLGLGLGLLVAFSLGLATVLSAVGVLSVVARQRIEAMSVDGRFVRTLPVLSSFAVIALGLAMLVRGVLGR